MAGNVGLHVWIAVSLMTAMAIGESERVLRADVQAIPGATATRSTNVLRRLSFYAGTGVGAGATIVRAMPAAA